MKRLELSAVLRRANEKYAARKREKYGIDSPIRLIESDSIKAATAALIEAINEANGHW